MALAQEDINFIKAHLAEWLEEIAPRRQFERELYERIVRVEEALAHQRELMQSGFEAMDKRFEQVEKRFEQVDKRFEQVDKRFEQVDKRFEQMDRRFETMIQRIDRFMIWSLGMTLTAAGLVIAALRLWPPTP